VDPFALLGVSPDATSEELAAAYRRLAKEWHPDRQMTAEATWRMAQINAAYDAARAAVAERAAARPAAPRAGTDRKVAASWVEPRLRKALGAELGRALHDGEQVLLVAPTSTWASPQARLAVTDRRLLWLREDAITDRVRSLRFDAIAEAGHRLSWPRRRTATVRVRDQHGRRTSFAELSPATAEEIVGHVTRRRRAA
jgi:hypothetical protein